MFLCIVRHAIRPIAVLSNKQTVHNVARSRLYVCTAHRAFVVNKRRMVLDLLYVLFFACIVIYYEFIVFSCFGVFAVQFGDIWTIWHWRKKTHLCLSQFILRIIFIFWRPATDLVSQNFEFIYDCLSIFSLQNIHIVFLHSLFWRWAFH